MTFQTIRGADATDLIQFIGEADKDDILLALNETAPMSAKGDSGDDSMTFINTTGVVGQVTAVGDAGADLFVFTQDGNNNTAARLYTSEIAGGDGADQFRIEGGALNTEFRGGADEDTFTLGGNYTNVQIKGGANGDVFTGGNIAAPVVLELDTSKIRGQGDNDRAMDFRGFLISSDDSTINGNGGNDLIQLGAFDTVDGLLIGGGTGDDDIQLDNDDTTDGIVINGGMGRDSVRGGGGDDAINGGADNDTLRGQDGADTILGNTGDDVIRGGGGNDSVEGAEGDDNLANLAADGGGNDTLIGGTGDDTITTQRGDNVIEGGDGADIINGAANADDDTITGGAGADTITVDGTDDVLTYTAISDSNAASSTDDDDVVTDAFDGITGFAVVEAAGVYTSGTQIDISAIANTLAGTTADSLSISRATDELVDAEGVAVEGDDAATFGAPLAAVDDFDALIADFNDVDDTLAWGSNAGADGKLEAFLFETAIDGGPLNTYLIINDTAGQITSGDLMLEFAAGTFADLVEAEAQIGAAIAEGSGLTII